MLVLLRLLALVLLASVFPLPAQAGPAFETFLGSWAHESWYETLVKTKSPRQAQAASIGHYSHLIFSAKDGSCHMDILMNSGHEGTQGDCTGLRAAGPGAPGEYLFGDEYPGPDGKATRMQVLPRSRIRFSTTGYDAVFVRIGNSIPQFINTTVLAGSYTDAKGRAYTFISDGSARWQGKKATYEIWMDYIPLCKVDVVEVIMGGQKRSYGLETVNGAKLLYNLTTDEAWTVREARPVLVLKPVAKKSGK